MGYHKVFQYIIKGGKVGLYDAIWDIETTMLSYIDITISWQIEEYWPQK